MSEGNNERTSRITAGGIELLGLGPGNVERVGYAEFIEKVKGVDDVFERTFFYDVFSGGTYFENSPRICEVVVLPSRIPFYNFLAENGLYVAHANLRFKVRPHMGNYPDGTPVEFFNLGTGDLYRSREGPQNLLGNSSEIPEFMPSYL